ncbi:hypothetical protein FHX08_003051 [Rhizobium sp. BK529]|nr:hypothetical protein [Rhizobium sp. BK529]
MPTCGDFFQQNFVSLGAFPLTSATLK